MGAVVAAVIARRERDIVDAFHSARATDPTTARDPGDVGVHQEVAFRLLVRRAVLRDAGGGRYFLDEPSLQAHRSARRRMLAVVLVAAIIILVSILLMGGAVALSNARTG